MLVGVLGENMSTLRWRTHAGIAVATAVALSLIAAAPAHADPATASVHGVVTASDSGDYVEGALVTVTWFDGQGSATDTTDANGAYEIDGIPTDTQVAVTPGTELTGTVTAPAWTGLRTASFPTQTPLTAGEQRSIDIELRPAHTTTIESSPVCLGASLTVSGYYWDAGDYRIRALDADGVSLFVSDGAFTVPGHGEFSVTLDTRADAPVGDYELATAPVGQNTWTPFETGVLAKDCAILSSVPTITGIGSVGSVLEVDAGTWDTEASLSVSWYADGEHLTDADGSPLELTTALEGKTITAAVTGVKDGFDPVTRTSLPTGKVIRTEAPSITGSTIVGSTLTAHPGSWSTGAILGYQWYADDAPIAGATASTLTLAPAQDGHRITVTVTGGGNGWATASASSITTTGRVMMWTIPKITGYAGTGQTLTAVPGTWSADTTFAYQWYAGGTSIPGATKATYKVATAYKAKTLTVKVTGSHPESATVSKISAATAKVATAATPTISGTAAYGSTLTAKPGTWTSGTTFTYQWYADGAAISGAKKSTLALGSAQKGAAITVRVTGKKSGYATVTTASKATLRVMTAATPSISGTARVTGTVTAKPGSWTSGTTFTYQWYANGAKISGATKSTLKIGSGLAGKRLTVTVTGKKSGYTTLAKTSKATAAVR